VRQLGTQLRSRLRTVNVERYSIAPVSLQCTVYLHYFAETENVLRQLDHVSHLTTI